MTGLDFIFILLSVLVVELPLLFIIGKFILKWGYDVDHIIFSGVIANMTSIAYLKFICPLFFVSDFLYYLYVFQAIGILIEAVILYNSLRTEFKKALLISIVVNIFSFLFAEKVLVFITTGKF